MTLKDFDKDRKRIKKSTKKEETHCNEQSDEEVHYNSVASSEEFNYIPDQEAKEGKEIMSAEARNTRFIGR